MNRKKMRREMKVDVREWKRVMREMKSEKMKRVKFDERERKSDERKCNERERERKLKGKVDEREKVEKGES